MEHFSDFSEGDAHRNTGKTLFAQLMEFLPRSYFTRIVDRMADHRKSGRLSAPSNTGPGPSPSLTYRDKPARIETWPLGPRIEAYRPLGFRQPVGARRWPMLGERRTGVFHAALALRDHTQADAVSTNAELLGLGPDQYRLGPGLDDHPLALIFREAHFRQRGGEDAHALDVRGEHYRVLSTSRMASCTSSMPSSSLEAVAKTSWVVATSTLPALCVAR